VILRFIRALWAQSFRQDHIRYWVATDKSIY